MHVHQAERGGVERSAGNRLVGAESRAQVHHGRQECVGELQLAPRFHAVIAYNPHLRRGRVVERFFEPVTAEGPGGFPGTVGKLREGLALLGRDEEFGDQARRAFARVFHQHAQLVLARSNLGGEFRLPRLAPTVVAGFRGQPEVTVNGEFHSVIGRGPEFGAFHFCEGRQGERREEKALAFRHFANLIRRVPNPLRSVQRRFRRGPLTGFIVANPLGCPVFRLEQAHGPHRRLTPDGFAAVPVPDLHFPEAPLMGDEGRALVCHGDGFVTGNPAAIPQVTALRLERLLAAGDQEAIGGLLLAALARLDNPTQPWRSFLDPQRINQVFTAEI